LACGLCLWIAESEFVVLLAGSATGR